MVEFLARVAEILESGPLTPESDFRAVSEWDSLKGFSLMIMLERDYGVRLTPETFMACKTVGALAELAHIAV